ncbi:MAG: DODA-type extradiol aromatic ring-opening family dioxygenase [Polyangiales bacterium]
MITRRVLLQSVAMTVASRALAAEDGAPVLLVSHGAPLFAIPDPARVSALKSWGKTLSKPKGIVVMTPHFASKKPRLGALGKGFAMYDLPPGIKKRVPPGLTYETPSNEALAARVTAIVPMDRSDVGGFDHTTWMPLSCLFPAADVPVLEIAHPYVPAAESFALGKKLAALRKEGIAVVASGGVTHNLAAMSFDETTQKVPSWSKEFDAWCAERIDARDADALVDFRNKAPAAELAHPDDGGHFRVFLFALGVAFASGASKARHPIVGFEGALSSRCVELT